MAKGILVSGGMGLGQARSLLLSGLGATPAELAVVDRAMGARVAWARRSAASNRAKKEEHRRRQGRSAQAVSSPSAARSAILQGLAGGLGSAVDSCGCSETSVVPGCGGGFRLKPWTMDAGDRDKQITLLFRRELGRDPEANELVQWRDADVCSDANVAGALRTCKAEGASFCLPSEWAKTGVSQGKSAANRQTNRKYTEKVAREEFRTAFTRDANADETRAGADVLEAAVVGVPLDANPTAWEAAVEAARTAARAALTTGASGPGASGPVVTDLSDPVGYQAMLPGLSDAQLVAKIAALEALQDTPLSASDPDAGTAATRLVVQVRLALAYDDKARREQARRGIVTDEDRARDERNRTIKARDVKTILSPKSGGGGGGLVVGLLVLGVVAVALSR